MGPSQIRMYFEPPRGELTDSRGGNPTYNRRRVISGSSGEGRDPERTEG